jgi:hypothetical protein
MSDKSPQTARGRSECEARIDPPTMSEGCVEIDLPNQFRLPREANRALVHVILAVRDRLRGSGREVA